MPEAVSFREFARRIGVSDMAVRKAVKSGRLKESAGVLESGRPGILDAALAEQEWNKTTSRSRTGGAGVHGGTAESNRAEVRPKFANPPDASSQDGEEPEEAPDDYPTGEFVSAATLVEAQRLATNERARKLKLDNDTRQGRLIPVEKVAKEAFEAERIIRETLLNLPARLASELAAEFGADSNKVYVRLDRALREALNTSADALLAVAQ
jgi:hypothetical protein